MALSNDGERLWPVAAVADHDANVSATPRGWIFHLSRGIPGIAIARALPVLSFALILVLATPIAPARADTPLDHWGTTGSHRLVDTAASPGAACVYDAVTQRLHEVRAMSPVIHAVDRTSGTDSQPVGIQAVLQRRTAGGSWTTVARSTEVRAVATDQRSPFDAEVSLEPSGSGRYRVRWRMWWYGSGDSRTGYAKHEVDVYRTRYGRIGAGVVRQSCAASLVGSPSILVAHGGRASHRVALTFDMGGRLTPAESIIEWLMANGVPATVFPTGMTGSTTQPGHRVLELIRQHPDLFDLGNHSWDHPRFTTLTRAQVASQLRRTDEAVARLAGQTSRPWFRPPYGAVDEDVLEAVGATGWSITVKWDVTTDDYVAPRDGGPTTDQLVERILSRVRGGSIVLLHLGGYRTRQALPQIVAGLRDRGLQPVRLDQLFDLDT
jgi:peptidoglycan/xylan/chitin deacetylase (PgdA/CDA1 family)